jgi:uncharacterized protein (DUF983 family)
MRSRQLSYTLHKIRIGLLLHCPSCERGQIFCGRFRLNETCPYCGSRFNRTPGDAIGGLYINFALAEFTALCGFVMVHLIFEPPVLHQFLFWIVYTIFFTTLLYRHTRGIWIAFLYLTGGIYPDLDCDHEYIASQTITVGKTPQEFE